MEHSNQFCTFYLGDDLFGVDVQRVQEVILYQEMTPVPLASSHVKGLINLRGQIVTAIETREHLGMGPRPEGELPMNVVVRTTDDHAVSFLVDEIGDVVNVDESTFEDAPEAVKARTRNLIVGIFKLEGELLLVLDIDRALQATAAQHAA